MTGAAPPLPVSVIIPAFNRPEMTARAVRSALAQVPAAPAEVIVVDDCSSDDTGAAARAAGATVIRHERNQGESASRNTAIAAATQPWVAMLDSDDEWLPHHLATLWPRREGHVVVASSCLICGEDELKDRIHGPGGGGRVLHSPADLFPANYLPSNAVLARRECVLEAGGFQPGLTRAADLDAWLRLLELGSGLALTEVTVIYHSHGGQVVLDREGMRSASRAVLAGFHDRPWFDSRLVDRWDGVMGWDALRAHQRAGHWGAAARQALYLLARRERLRGTLALLAWRGSLRRRSGRVGRNGEPSLAVLEVALEPWARRAYPGRPLRRLGKRGRGRALLTLLRRPPAELVVRRGWEAVLARALGARPVRARD